MEANGVDEKGREWKAKQWNSTSPSLCIINLQEQATSVLSIYQMGNYKRSEHGKIPICHVMCKCVSESWRTRKIKAKEKKICQPNIPDYSPISLLLRFFFFGSLYTVAVFSSIIFAIVTVLWNSLSLFTERIHKEYIVRSLFLSLSSKLYGEPYRRIEL